MAVFLPQARPEVPQNALLNLEPINNAIDGWQRNALLQSQQQMQREEAGMRRQELGMRQRQFDANQQKDITQRFGALAQVVDAEQDPAKRDLMWKRIVAMHPGRTGLDQTYMDPMQGPKLLMAEAGNFTDPLDRQYKQAQIGALNRQGQNSGMTDDQREYAFAQQQGFKGTFLDYVQAKKSNMEHAAPKEWQTKDAMFADRLSRTNAIIDKVAGVDPQTGEPVKGAYNPAQSSNAWFPDDNAWSNLGLANSINSKEWQQYQQAAREGIAAILRKDTGAAVTETEWNLYFPMLYPQPGDGPDVVRQKRQTRMSTFEALKGSSGPAYKLMFPGQGQQAPQQQPTAAPKPGTVMDGYRFKGGNPADPNAWEPAQGRTDFNVPSTMVMP